MQPLGNRLSFARGLRRRQTDAERRIWSRLRGRRLLGYKFRRQHPVGPYFADFACLEIGLVVELDGGQHGLPHALLHDGVRTDVLAGHGLEVVRFWDNDVLRDTDAVIAAIARKITALSRLAGESTSGTAQAVMRGGVRVSE